jgi:hypothetical protein
MATGFASHRKPWNISTAEGLPQSSLSANIGARLNDLVGRRPNACKPHRFNDAVGGATFDVALPSLGLSKALLDQGAVSRRVLSKS